MIRVLGLALVAITMLSMPKTARLIAPDAVQYAIDPGSQYTYKPSPWLGIPGGQPSEYQLDFGISGSYHRRSLTTQPTP